MWSMGRCRWTSVVVVLASCLGVTFLASAPADAATFTWQPTGSGTYSWFDTVNWLGTASGTYPNAANDATNLGTALTTDQTVSLGGTTVRSGTLTIGTTGQTLTLVSGTLAGLNANGIIPVASSTINYRVPISLAGVPATSLSFANTAGLNVRQNFYGDILAGSASVTLRPNSQDNNGGSMITYFHGAIDPLGDSTNPVSFFSRNGSSQTYLLGESKYRGTTGGAGGTVFFNSIADTNVDANLVAASALGAPVVASSTISQSGNRPTTFEYIGTGHASNRDWSSAGPYGLTINASGEGTLRLSGNVSVMNSSTTTAHTLGGSGVGVLSGNISGTSTGSFVKSGTGSWTLSGTNTLTGTTNIQAGTLVFAKRTSLYNGGTNAWIKANILTGSGGAATLGVGVGGTDGLMIEDVKTLITNLSGDVSSGGMRATSSWGFDTTNTGSTFTVADVIANTSGTRGGAIGVTKLGTGTLTLSNTNTYTYGTRIDGGVLAITNASALGSGTGFLRFGGGTLDLGGNTVDRGGGMTATAGGLRNGVISGTGGLTKTGTGTFTIHAAANTFTGQVSIQEGVVEAVALAASGDASSLGAPAVTTTINLGNAATAGTLRFIGSTSGSTNRPIQLSGSTGGGTLEANGSVPLVLTGSIGAANGSKTLTLSGTNTQDNTIGAITKMTTGTLGIIKDGPGLWRLTGTSDFNGGLTVRNGTIVAAANDGSIPTAPGVFGIDGGVTVGDSAPGASGTAALFVADGTIRRQITVSGTGSGGTQAVLIGAAGLAGTFSGADLSLGRDVALVAAPGGSVAFDNQWFGASGSGTPLANVAIGADGYTGTVRFTRNGTFVTQGSVAVRYGTALLTSASTTLDGAGTLTIDAPATLGGIGTVAAPLGGAGIVAPGNSAGILTAEAFDPTGGLDLAFEFTGATPTYTNSGTSVNDILRLTGTSPFLGGSLTSGNVVSLYLPAGATSIGAAFTGGFFTDLSSGSFASATFLSTIASGSYAAYYEDSGGGVPYGGKNYSPLSALGLQIQVGTTTVSGTTNFQTGTPVVDGQVSTFTVVVPEPATIALAGIGAAAAAWMLRRRRPPL